MLSSLRKVGAIAGLVSALCAIIGVIVRLTMFTASKADAAELKAVEVKVGGIEAVHDEENKRLDRIEKKLDWMILQQAHHR